MYEFGIAVNLRHSWKCGLHVALDVSDFGFPGELEKPDAPLHMDILITVACILL